MAGGISKQGAENAQGMRAEPRMEQKPTLINSEDAAKLRNLVDEGAVLVKHNDGSMLLVSSEAWKKFDKMASAGLDWHVEMNGWGAIKDVGGIRVVEELHVSDIEDMLQLADSGHCMVKLQILFNQDRQAFDRLMNDLTEGLVAYSSKNDLLEGRINTSVRKELAEEMGSGRVEKIYTSGREYEMLDASPEISDKWNDMSLKLFMNFYIAVRVNQIRANSMLRRFEQHGEYDDGGVVKGAIEAAMAAKGAGAEDHAAFFAENRDDVKKTAYLIMNSRMTEGMDSKLLDYFVESFVAKEGITTVRDVAAFEWKNLAAHGTVAGSSIPADVRGGEYLDAHYHPPAKLKSGDSALSIDLTLQASGTDIKSWTDNGAKENDQWAAICTKGGVRFYKASKAMYEDFARTGDELEFYRDPNWKMKYLGLPEEDREKIKKELGLAPK